MAGNTNIAGGYKRLTATANVSPRGVTVLGFLVASTNVGTIQLYDDAATGTTTPITGVITPAAGQFIPLYASTTNGLYAVIGGTALDVTVVFA